MNYSRVYSALLLPVIVGMLVSCGLPTAIDYADPPVIINGGGSGSSRVEFTLARTNGFVIYYKVIRQGSYDVQTFSGSTSVGERIFQGYGFSKAYPSPSTNQSAIMLWAPSAPILNLPVHVLVDYSQPEDPKVTVADNAGVTLASGNFALTRRTINGQSKFSNLNTTDSDMTFFNNSGGGTSATVSLAALNYKLNQVTYSQSPSAAVFLGYIDGLRVN